MAIKAPSSNANAASTPQALTFPAQTFAKLSPSAYLTAHLTSPRGPLRPSGRKPSESRPPTVHTGSLTHSHGSAVVRCGDTAVVCGVRGEILRVEDVADWESIRQMRRHADGEEGETAGKEANKQEEQRQGRKQDAKEIAYLNLLVPNLELATGCSPAHLPGGPPSILAQTLTQRILTLLHTSQLLNFDDLRIWSQPPPSPSPSKRTAGEQGEEEEPIAELAKAEIKAFWTLYIDILFISLSGNAFDAAWFSILAALSNVRLPNAWYDSDAETVFCSPLSEAARALELYDVPVALSFAAFWGEEGGREGKGKKWILADPDGFEEGLSREGATIVVGAGGRVVRVEKNGGGGIGANEMRVLVDLARGRRDEWMSVSGGN